MLSKHYNSNNNNSQQPIVAYAYLVYRALRFVWTIFSENSVKTQLMARHTRRRRRLELDNKYLCNPLFLLLIRLES